MTEMISAYIEWDAGLGDSGLGGAGPPQAKDGEGLCLQIVDVFSEYSALRFAIPSDSLIG